MPVGLISGTSLRAVTAWPCHVTSQKTVAVDREHASDMRASSCRLTDCGNSPDCSCSSTLTNDRTYDLFSCSIWRKSVITSVSMSPNHSLPTFACTATSMKNVCVLLRDKRSPMKNFALQCWHSIRSVYTVQCSDWHTDAVQSYSTHCYNTRLTDDCYSAQTMGLAWAAGKVNCQLLFIDIGIGW